jgi:hypothetical protein
MTIPPTDGIAVYPEAETDDDLLSDLDMTPAPEAESDAEIMAALDACDPPADVVASDPAPPEAQWLADFKAVARKHRPFSTAQIVKIFYMLNAVDDPAVEAGR